MCSGILLEKRQIMPEVSFNFLRELLLKSLVVSLSYQNILCMKSKPTIQPTKKLVFNRRSNQPFNWHTPSVEQKNSNSYFVKSSLFFWTMNENYLLDVWSDGRGGYGLAGVGQCCWMAWNKHPTNHSDVYPFFALSAYTSIYSFVYLVFRLSSMFALLFFFISIFIDIMGVYETKRDERIMFVYECVCGCCFLSCFFYVYYYLFFMWSNSNNNNNDSRKHHQH